MNIVSSLKNFLITISIAVLITSINHALANEPESTNPSDENVIRILVLDNCDKDNKNTTFPFGDKVIMLNSKGVPVRKILGLKTDEFLGGCNAISVSEDGRFFIVCENARDRLHMYEIATGKIIWSLWVHLESAVFANDLIYAVNSENVFAIDYTGTIVKHGRVGGYGIAVDTNHNCLWIIGTDIQKCSMDLQLELKMPLTLNTIRAGAFSVDINPDGSVWVTERDIYRGPERKNRLLKVSLGGDILKKIDLSFYPWSICTDRHDDTVWTTGKGDRDFSKLGDDWPETISELNELVGMETCTQKFDSHGNLLFKIAQGGDSIALDTTDNSVWIAGTKTILHYSSTGEKLDEYTCVSDEQKVLAVVPAIPKN